MDKIFTSPIGGTYFFEWEVASERFYKEIYLKHRESFHFPKESTKYSGSLLG